MADIWPVFDERAPSGRPPPLVHTALSVLSELVDFAHFAKRERHDAYLGALGLLNPENHARLVVLLRMSLEDDQQDEDWDLRNDVTELLGHATSYPSVAALAFSAFAEHTDALAQTLRLDDTSFQVVTIIGSLAQGPLPDRAEALTRAGCLQPLIDNFEINDPPDQATLGCALASFSAHAANCRVVRDVFLRRQNVERLLVIANLCRDDAETDNPPSLRHWHCCKRDAYAMVLSDVRLAARLQPEGCSDSVVDDMLEASDTPEAAACVERHVAWRKRRRVQQDGQLYYGTGAGCEDDA
jgi:hypothetical protein